MQKSNSPPANHHQFNPGDLVFCRQHKNPYWPARVSNCFEGSANGRHKMITKTKQGNEVLVYWCSLVGEAISSWVQPSKMVSFHPELIPLIIVERSHICFSKQHRATNTAIYLFNIMHKGRTPKAQGPPEDLLRYQTKTWQDGGEDEDDVELINLNPAQVQIVSKDLHPAGKTGKATVAANLAATVALPGGLKPPKSQKRKKKKSSGSTRKKKAQTAAKTQPSKGIKREPSISAGSELPKKRPREAIRQQFLASIFDKNPTDQTNTVANLELIKDIVEGEPHTSQKTVILPGFVSHPNNSRPTQVENEELTQEVAMLKEIIKNRNEHILDILKSPAPSPTEKRNGSGTNLFTITEEGQDFSEVFFKLSNESEELSRMVAAVEKKREELKGTVNEMKELVQQITGKITVAENLSAE